LSITWGRGVYPKKGKWGERVNVDGEGVRTIGRRNEHYWGNVKGHWLKPGPHFLEEVLVGLDT